MFCFPIEVHFQHEILQRLGSFMRTMIAGKAYFRRTFGTQVERISIDLRQAILPVHVALKIYAMRKSSEMGDLMS